MWSDAWGVRMEHILRNALYALLEQKDATLSDISWSAPRQPKDGTQF